MATVSQVLDFVTGNTSPTDGYSVVGDAGIVTCYAKYQSGTIVEYYCFSNEALKLIALDDAVVPSANTNISKYAEDATGNAIRYSKDAKGVLQYEDDANVAHYIFYAGTEGTSLKTFVTDNERYSTSTSFKLTVIESDATSKTYEKTANTNIIHPEGSNTFIVFDEIGFLQAAIERIVDSAGVVSDLVAGDSIIEYVRTPEITEYYKKAPTNSTGFAAPIFQQVNVEGAPIEAGIWREYGTPDSITVYQFATGGYSVGSKLVSGGYTAPGATSAEVSRTFTLEAAGVISELVSDVKHLYAYTNDGYASAIEIAVVGNKINDIRSITAKPISTTGIVHDVVFSKVLLNSGIYRAFAGYSTDDIRPELFANGEYSTGHYLYVMKARSDSDDLSLIASAVKKEADGLVNVQEILGNVPQHSSQYSAYKNVGLKNAAGLMAVSEQVTKGEETFTLDAENVLRIGGTYISYGAVSKHEFATNTYYLVDKVLRQRTVNESDENVDVVMSKWAVDSVNVEGVSHTETYTEAGIRATVHREGEAARLTLKVLSASDDSVLRTLTREATDLPAEVLSGVKYYYAITNTAYEIAINNAAVGNMINDNRAGQLTADTTVDQYEVKFSKVTYLNAVYRAFTGYSESDINPELFANGNQYVKDDLFCVMKTRAQSDNLSKIESAVKKVNESLINVQAIVSNAPQHTNQYNAYKNIGLKNAAADMANAEQVTKGDVTYTKDATNVLLTGTTYISYESAISNQVFATGKYAVDDTLRKRSVNESDENVDVVVTKFAIDAVDQEGLAYTEAYSANGLKGAIQRDGGRNTVKDMNSGDEYTRVQTNVLKKGTTYYEYNGLETITLRAFSTGEYADKDYIVAMNKTSGATGKTYQRVIQTVILDSAASRYYEYNSIKSKPARLSAMTALANVPVDALIVDMISEDNNEPTDSSALYKKYALNLVRKHNGTEWYAYSIRAFASASLSDDFIENHTVTNDGTTYVYLAYKVLKLQGDNEYISFDGVVTERQFATSSVYGSEAKMMMRASTQEDETSDIVVDKWDNNVVNTSADPAASHVYGDLGMRNIANMTNNLRPDGDITPKMVKRYASDETTKLFKYVEKYVLQDNTDLHYYEYNNLATITLESFTTDNDTYPVSRKLFGRNTINGEAVVMYEKVIASITKKDDLNKFWVYSVLSRDVAMNNDDGTIPVLSGANRSEIHMIIEGQETVYYKNRVGVIIDQQAGPIATPDQVVEGYEALSALVTSDSTFEVEHTVEFKLEGKPSTFYVKVDSNLIKKFNTNEYISYSGAVSRKAFATGVYATNATLIQRDASKTVESEVFASDITLTKLGDNAVNRKVGTGADDAQTYAYEKLGLKTAAQSGASKSTVRQVTADDVSGDSSVTDYTKVSANILKLNNEYFEYNDFGSLSIQTFSGSGYNAGDVLHKMSKTTGIEETADYNTPYTKKMLNVVMDSVSSYYVYGGNEEPAAKSVVDVVPIGALLIMSTRANEPRSTDQQYTKRAVALLQVGSSGAHNAYAHIGLRSAAVSVLSATQTVTYSGTIWTYSAANELKTGTAGSAQYLTFVSSTPFTVEADFARNAPYIATDVLLQRTLTSDSDINATPTDVTITKLAAKVVNNSTDEANTHSYDVDGLKNAAQLADSTAIKSKILDMSASVTYLRVSQYLLKNESSTEYFEFNALDTLSIRSFATTGSYSVNHKLHKMNTESGAELNVFTKKYADIVIDGNSGEYYCYNETNLVSIANEDLDIIAVAKFVWEMAADSNKEATGADLKWTKTERYVLRAAHNGDKKKYNIYNITIGAGIPLNEFACDATYANGDRLIRKVAPNDAYDRVIQSVLHKDDEAADKYNTYYYGDDVLKHMEFEKAANSEVIAVGSTLVAMDDGAMWIKKSTGIINKDLAHVAFGTSLGPQTMATDDATYAVGATLRLVNIDDSLSVNYVKNLSGVLYQYQSDEYECYGADGLKNAAQSANLSENRDAAHPYVLRPELNQIELNAPIKDMVTGAYYFKYRQNVVVAATKSGSSYSVTAPAHFYDYTAASAFGTLPLQEFATSTTFEVDMQVEDALHEQGTWTKKAADVILQGTTYYSYSDAILATAGNKWLAYNGVVGHTVEEKGAVGSTSYSILENGVLQSESTYYAYSIASDAAGLTLNTFAIQGATYPGTVLVDRTSARAGPSYTRTDAGLLRDDASNYIAFTEASLKTAAGKTLTTSTTVTEHSTGTWTMTGRKVYTWFIANVLKIASEAAYYVYSLSSLSLNTYATHPTYAKNDTLVDRSGSALYDGPRYRKVLAEHGVLERKANLAASAESDLLTYDGNGVLGLRTASLAAVADISDGTILVPEDSDLSKHLRCAKGLLRKYATASTLSSSFKVFQIDSSDEPVAALRLAAKNLDADGNALTGDRVVASESSLYVTGALETTYNVASVNYVKDSGVFVDTLRVGTNAVSDKITYADLDGTHYTVLKNMCEQDANGSLAASSSAVAKYLNKQITDRSVSPVVTYYVLSRGVLRVVGSDANEGATGNDHVFSDNGLVAAATNSDSMQSFSLHSVSGGAESTSTFKRLRRGLLVSAFIIDGVPATDNEDGAAILYYSDYSASAKDDLRNMNYYLYSLAKQGSVGGTTTTDADVITAINTGSIKKLYTIVTKIGGSSKAQQFAIVEDGASVVSNIVRVSDIDGANEYYLAYNETGVTKSVPAGAQPYSVVAEALGRDGLSNAANSSVVLTGSLLYTASSSDNFAMVKNYEFKKNGAGSIDGPGPANGAGANNTGSVFTYSAEGIRTFAKLNRQLSTTVPKGVLPKKGSVDGNDTANVYTVWNSKTYFTWEQSVVITVVGGVQNYEVYDGAANNFARRFAMAEANINAIDYADTQAAGRAAYVNGSKLIVCGANANTSDAVKTYSKVDTGLIKLDSNSQHYAFSDYGLAAGANLSSLPVNMIEMVANEDMATVTSPVWNVKISKLLKNGAAWRSYNATGATVAANKEYFAANSTLADVLSVYSYAAPNTTALQRTFTNVLDNDETSLIRKITVAGSDGESEYQAYGHAGLALIANSDLEAFTGANLKVREVEMIAFANGNNSANPGKYKKLQQGAMYKDTNVMLYDENKFQEVMDRFDITEFSTMDVSNLAGIKNTIYTTNITLNPQYRLPNPPTDDNNVILPGYAKAKQQLVSDNEVVNGIRYNLYVKLERDFMINYTAASGDRLSNVSGNNTVKIKPFIVTQKNGSLQHYAVQTFKDYVNYY